MSVLCMDENGRIFVASRDSSSGKGVESVPETVQDYGANLYQNPYLKTSQDSLVEARMNAETNKIQDESAASYKAAQASQAAFELKAQASEMNKTPAQSQELIAEAVMQGMQGNADFNQLHITDSEYSARHQAILQGMGRRPAMGDTPYVQSVPYSNPTEAAQADLESQAIVQLATSRQSEQDYYEQTKDVPLNTIPASTPDPDAQALLIGEGEMYFDTEEEAKAYLKADATKNVQAASPGVPTLAVPAVVNKNWMMYAAAGLAAWLLMKKGG